MKKTAIFFLLIAMLFSVVACELFYSEDDYYSDEYYDGEEYTDDGYAEQSAGDSQPESAPPVAPSDSNDACQGNESYHAENGLCYLDNGQAIPLFVDLMDGVVEASANAEENLLDDEYVLVTYAVNGDEISSPSYESVSSDLESYQNDTATQETIWKYYTGMIPADARELLVGYKVITDGQGGSLAMVEQSPDDPTEWLLNVDIADTNDLRDLTYTLIHEYGHLLTLNENQINIDEDIFYNPDDEDLYAAAETSCATYFPGEGCAKSDSYINLFYEKFWAGIYDEWSETQYIEDDYAYYEALDNFYYKYEDQFVTDYAATNTGEDIAESWTFFIISDKPSGNTIAEEKILFFYQFPELVQLREEIVARTYSRMIRMQ